jgi:hypothetical protein
MLEVILDDQNFHRMPPRVASPDKPQNLQKWYTAAYYATISGKILSILSRMPLSSEISCNAIANSLRLSETPEEIRALKQFPNAQNVTMETLNSILKQMEEKNQQDLMVALQEWFPSFEK